MITIPAYDLLILPGVTFYFRKDSFQGVRVKLTEQNVGEDLLFVMTKFEKDNRLLTLEDVYPIGITGKVDGVDEDGNIRITAGERVEITAVSEDETGLMAEAVHRGQVEDLPEEEERIRFERIKNDLLNFSKGFQWGMWARSMILHWKSFSDVICSLCNYMNLDWEEKYAILETDSVKDRVERIERAVYEMMETFKISEEAQTAEKDSNEQLYRESALKKQIEFLQRQLDEMHPENVSDVRKFEKKIQESGMNEEARREAEKVLNRMKQEGKDSHEYGMLYDYLDFVTSLSWKNETMHDIDLKEAETILDEEHYGLKKVKERIIQQLAVMALNKKQSGSILLFVGAPGTGKTSIGQSIARALHRGYVRISLGGVHDEAEIRGHRRTYVGAMPGRIMEGIRRSGAKNPVMVLDEVDKLTASYGGDPASALLEVLDPEQNHTFTDHYMNVPYDLSDVLFVCTANTTDTIPEPLLNRMEVITFPGYTPVEKAKIARKYLLPRALKSMGIRGQNLKLTDGAIMRIIEEYTAEAGVRGLKKQIETLCRFAAVKLVKGEQKSISISEKRVPEFLGRKALSHEKVPKDTLPGIVTGLAWTQAGGEILFIESCFTKGSGKVQITGQLGDVMKESAQIAITLVKGLYPSSAQQFEQNDLHIHVPAGAVPKDGPSAGITLVTALSSLVNGKTVDPHIAMTGEVSLRGQVMPIGGLPEKLMAAQRAGVKRVFIPWDNREDLEDVAEEVKEKLEIVPVKQIREVLDSCLQ